MSQVTLHINGRAHSLNVDPSTPLLSVLRDGIGLTGAKYGCGEGQCGACTVLIDGRAIKSCITPVSKVAGRAITTIEGLERDGKLHPVQQAFLDKQAFQCGYCTPGMIMAGAALLREKPNATAEEIKRALEGNMCRCGVYPRIVEAVRAAQRRHA
jgi:aerobic-type carbon monoxide dehydrogenase small subunit (CoxS/CutS family)